MLLRKVISAWKDFFLPETFASVKQGCIMGSTDGYIYESGVQSEWLLCVFAALFLLQNVAQAAYCMCWSLCMPVAKHNLQRLSTCNTLSTRAHAFISHLLSQIYTDISFRAVVSCCLLFFRAKHHRIGMRGKLLPVYGRKKTDFQTTCVTWLYYLQHQTQIIANLLLISAAGMML